MAGSESTLVIGARLCPTTIPSTVTTYDVTYNMDAMCIHAAMIRHRRCYEATTVNASYWLFDDGQAYVKYEDIDGAADDLDIGINHYYSDNVRANVCFEDGLGTGGDDYAVVGGIQFTF